MQNSRVITALKHNGYIAQSMPIMKTMKYENASVQSGLSAAAVKSQMPPFFGVTIKEYYRDTGNVNPMAREIFLKYKSIHVPVISTVYMACKLYCNRILLHDSLQFVDVMHNHVRLMFQLM
jgi:hypothetical protein